MKEKESFMPNPEGKIAKIAERLENEPVFGFLKEIKKEFPMAELYLVGGAVRDLFLGRECKDYDFIVRGVETKKLQGFLAKIGIVNLVGRVFGVFKFVPEAQRAEFKEKQLEPFDLALPRTEHSYLSGGYRDFDVQSDPHLPVEKDLERRDFTINAIAVKIITNGRGQTSAAGATRGLTSALVDPFDGLKDLDKKIIRTVGEPKERFQEDYSRMLRALRFACELNFKIEKKTFEAIKKNIGVLNKKIERRLKPAATTDRVAAPFTGALGEVSDWIVPRETIAKEMLKTFYADPVRAFDLYDQTGAFDVLLPEVAQMKKCPQPPEFHSEGDVFVHTRLALEIFQSGEYKKIFGKEKPSAQLVMALLLHDIGKPPTLKTPEKDNTDRIRFNEHAEVGAEMARAVIRRLKLESQAEKSPLHLDAGRVGWLIENHLLFLHGDPKKMRAATIEKYFFNPLAPGDELMRLAFCDAQATISAPDAPVNMDNFNAMRARIEEVGKLTRQRNLLPPPLLNGDEIMKILKIKPGQEVGKIILALREEQLEKRVKTKKEARKFINVKYKILNC